MRVVAWRGNAQTGKRAERGGEGMKRGQVYLTAFYKIDFLTLVIQAA